MNFLGKLMYFLVQAKKQYGSKGLRMLTGVVELSKEALSFQGVGTKYYKAQGHMYLKP
jgi:hypothetical protein